MENKTKIIITTDGACSGNPGPGGYAAVLRFGEHKKEISGSESRTTNNRMELMAAVAAVSALKRPCDITFRTDSTNLINAIQCLDVRSKNGWVTKTGAKVANCDLHQALLKHREEGGHTFNCIHVKGHSGDADNERCDTLAKEAISKGPVPVEAV